MFYSLKFKCPFKRTLATNAPIISISSLSSFEDTGHCTYLWNHHKSYSLFCFSASRMITVCLGLKYV